MNEKGSGYTRSICGFKNHLGIEIGGDNTVAVQRHPHVRILSLVLANPPHFPRPIDIWHTPDRA
jgi:hypothetical protein